MAQLTDTSAIHRLVRRARLRIRVQCALEGGTTAAILAAAAALASIFATRIGWVSSTTGIYLLIASGLIVVAGAAIAASRKLDDELVARRIDRASGLADRLSTAIAFARASQHDDPTTHELMVAAIKDGVRAAPRANLVAATPFAAPPDLRVAGGFVAICALAAGLALPPDEHAPGLVRATPDHAPAGTEVVIDGYNLWQDGVAPRDASVFLGSLDKSRPVELEDWGATKIKIRIPTNAPVGDTKLLAFVGGTHVGAVPFTVIDKKDQRFHKEDSVALDPDEKAYVEAILAELKNVAQRDKVPELDDFAKKIEQLLAQAENGEITKEQLLDALSKAEDALQKDADPNPGEVAQKLGEMGKELAKDQVTKDLGDALEKQDLEKAKQELEKLADKLENKELSDKQKDELAKKLEQVAKQMEKQDKQDQQKQDQQQQKLQDEIRRLEKQKDQAKNDQQRQEMERRLEEKKRELQKLQKDQQDKDQSDTRRALKRLEKDMEKAAENLQKPKKDPNQKDQKDQQDQEENEKQASRNLKDAARETGRVDQDQRKQATQKKMSSQMDDLREAMRRAKQKGNKGPQDPFNKQGKNSDFIARARGQKGQGQGGAWKPGQGQGQGQGQQNGGQGSGAQQSDTWGTGHDPNLQGDPTAMSGNQKDESVQGQQSKDGNSIRQTILAAAQKGFASAKYQKIYADYQRIVEEVMRTEKLPSSYKYYVKRYFAKIHPEMDTEK